MIQPDSAHEKDSIIQIKEGALKLANAGELREAINSVIFALDHQSNLLEHVQLPYDMVFFFSVQDIAHAKERVSKILDTKKVEDTAIENVVKSIFEDYSDHLRKIAKKSFIIGKASQLKRNPNLSRQQVVEFITDLLDKAWFPGDDFTE